MTPVDLKAQDWECPICWREFSSKARVKRHMGTDPCLRESARQRIELLYLQEAHVELWDLKTKIQRGELSSSAGR